MGFKKREWFIHKFKSKGDKKKLKSIYLLLNITDFNFLYGKQVNYLLTNVIANSNSS